MSIVDSRADHVAAAERLSSATEPQLTTLLAEWAVRAREQQDSYNAAVESLSRLRREFAESQEWLALIGEEIRARRLEQPGAESLAGTGDVPNVFRDALGGR